MGTSLWEGYWRRVGSPKSVQRQHAIGTVVYQDISNAIWPKGPQPVTVMVDAEADLRSAWSPRFESTYRVVVNLDTGAAEVVCLGIDRVDAEGEGIYDSTNDLPKWMQEKLAVLSMIEVNPPQTEVVGVGMRIDENTYWLLEG